MLAARFLVIGLVLTFSFAAMAQEGAAIRVEYRGELLDDQNRPISGVFPLTFKLYRSEAAEAAVWEEQQFVAVFEGMYEIRLGRVEGIPAEWSGQERIVEVALGEVTLTTQTIELVPWTPESETPNPTIRHERFVDLAGRAISSDRAGVSENCRTLSGETADSLDHFVELRQQLDELRSRVESPAGNRIGRETVVIPRIGGAGGNRYERNCPPGFVMTGARGGAGNLIDGFRIICTQLE